MLHGLEARSEAAPECDVNLARELREADARVQALIDERAAVALARIKFQFRHARRVVGQRLRNDGREQRREGK